MPYQAVHAFRESLVERWFEIHAKRLVPLIANGGHPFGSGEAASVDMRCAGGFLHEEAVRVSRSMLSRHGPVLGLRDGARSKGLKRIEGSAVRAARLALDAKAKPA